MIEGVWLQARLADGTPAPNLRETQDVAEGLRAGEPHLVVKQPRRTMFDLIRRQTPSANAIRGYFARKSSSGGAT